MSENMENKILSCIVAHNRLDLTKLTVESYLNTVSIPHFLVVVDNASTDGTEDYLKSITEIDAVIYSIVNGGPGRACNVGWEYGLIEYPNATFLHRSDNDIFYGSNWDTYAMEVFEAMPKLGQLGILDLKDQHYPGQAPEFLYESNGHKVNKYYPNIGGNHITRKILWDKGLRHIELSWAEGGGNEDVLFSQGVGERGYIYAHSVFPLATHLGVWWGNLKSKRYREYYRETYRQRLNTDIYPDIEKGYIEYDF